MLKLEDDETKQVSILRRVVEQQSLIIHHGKLKIHEYENKIEKLLEDIDVHKKTLSELYPEKEVLEGRIKYLDDSIRELNFHLAETKKSRERMINSLSWRCTAWIRWIKRPRSQKD